MTTRRNDIKKSDFISVTSILPTDTFDFVSNGANKKITYANLLIALGVCGSLQAAGSPGAASVLQILAGVNYIRGLEGGNGISTSISPYNGIQIDHNFTFDATGVQMTPNPSISSPVIRSLLAGAGINVAAVGNAIQISATGITVASNIVIINQMSDFPAAVAGVRTLADDTAYLISAKLTTSDRFVLGNNTVVYGADSAVSSLTYTGSDAMFTSTTGNAKITLITLRAVNGKVFDITGASGVFQFVNSTITACDELGTFSNLYGMQITDCAIFGVATNGAQFSGTHGLFVGTRNIFECNAGSAFDLGTAVFSQGFSIETSFITLAAGAHFLKGAADSANIAAGSLGVVFNTRISGSGTPLDTISPADKLWEFIGNDDIPNSHDQLLATNAGTTVTISVVSTPVIIGATWVAEEATRFTATAGGVFTYTGKGGGVVLHATITATVASGTNKSCAFYVAINGTKVANSKITRTYSAGTYGNFGLVWSMDLANGDTVSLLAENNTDTQDIVIDKAILGIH